MVFVLRVLFGNAVWLLLGFCGFVCVWLVLGLVLGWGFVSDVSCLLSFLVLCELLWHRFHGLAWVFLVLWVLLVLDTVVFMIVWCGFGDLLCSLCGFGDLWSGGLGLGFAWFSSSLG